MCTLRHSVACLCVLYSSHNRHWSFPQTELTTWLFVIETQYVLYKEKVAATYVCVHEIELKGERFCSLYFAFPLWVSFYQRCRHVFIKKITFIRRISGRTLGNCRQSNALAEVGGNWTEKCLRIVAVRPANRCPVCCHQQPNEAVIKRNPIPIIAAFTSVIIAREFHFQTGSSPASSCR